MYYLIFAQFGIMLQWTNIDFIDGDLLEILFEKFQELGHQRWLLNYSYLFSFKKNIVVHFSIIYKSNKCFIISISNSSNVLKISPKKKKKPNKHTPQATTKLMLINCFLNIVNNS